MATAPASDDDDIDQEVIQFFAWLKKRGAKRQLVFCKIKWDDILETPVEDTVALFDSSRIAIQTHPSTGEPWVRLIDKPWADTIMKKHDEEVPHHRHWRKLKK